MRYVKSAVGSQYYPKLLGTYESEVQPLVKALASCDWAVIANVGAAEGYYAVGLKLHCPGANVVAFEAKTSAHALIGSLAKLNGVDLDIRGHCNTRDLEQVLAPAGRKLVVCDVEGFEVALLNPADVPSLKDCYILAELHEAHAPGVEQILSGRFAASHRLQIVRQRQRQRSDFPFDNWFTALYPDSHVLALLHEGRRRGTDWLWAEPAGSDKLSLS